MTAIVCCSVDEVPTVAERKRTDRWPECATPETHCGAKLPRIRCHWLNAWSPVRGDSRLGFLSRFEVPPTRRMENSDAVVRPDTCRPLMCVEATVPREETVMLRPSPDETVVMLPPACAGAVNVTSGDRATARAAIAPTARPPENS